MNVRYRPVCVSIAVSAMTVCSWTHAKDGDFVKSFGVQGREQITFSPNLDSVNGNAYGFIGVAIQPSDGKIVINSTVLQNSKNNFGVLRLSADGTLDSAFNANTGQALFNFGLGGPNGAIASAIALDTSERILVAGTAYGDPTAGGADCAIARLTPAGVLDTSFSGDGLATVAYDIGPVGQREDGCFSIALQDDGRILMAGSAQIGLTAGPTPQATHKMTVTRISTNGVRDTTFNGSGTEAIDFGVGIVNSEGIGIVQQSDHGILTVGYADDSSGFKFVAMAKLTANGALDSSFGTGGKVLFDPGVTGYLGAELTDVVTLPDNSFVGAGIIFATSGNIDFFFAKFLANGSVDTSFGNNGRTVVPFDLGGALTDVAIALKVDNQGRFVANGFATSSSPPFLMALTRLTPNGNVDETFGTLGTEAISTAAPAATAFGDEGLGLAIAADGSLVVTSLANYDAVANHAHVGIAKLVNDTVFSDDFDF